jgi:hypothetical protein
MSKASLRAFVSIAATLLTAVGVRSGPTPHASNELWQYRNLGKAFYENPTTHEEAVEQFQKALQLAPDSARERLNYALALLRAGKTDKGIAELLTVQRQDPSIPHTWFNLGIAYKKRSTPEANVQAIVQFEKMIELAPDDAVSRYNLGALYKSAGRSADALKQFDAASHLDPAMAGPHFQLYNLYRDPRLGTPADSERELKTFQTIKKRQAGVAIPEDLDWSAYAEIYDPVDPGERIVDATPGTVTFREREVLSGVDAGTAGLVVFDADGDDRPDVLVWSSRGVRLLAGGETPVPDAGLEQLTDVISIAPGDFDNDGAIDLAVVTTTGVSVWRNAGRRTFAPHPAAIPPGRFLRAVWLDYDHDYDVDLLLLGPRSYLLRNADAGFSDVTNDFPFAAGEPSDAVLFKRIADTTGQDLLVSYRDRQGVLYRDRLGGTYEALTIDALPAGAHSLIARDINRDSWMDVAATGPAGVLLLLLNAWGRLVPVTTPAVGGPVVTADFENAGVVDVGVGGRLLRWTPTGVRDAPFRVRAAVTRATADFDRDGRLDVIAVDQSGTVWLATNATSLARHWIRVVLAGVKNLKAAPGAEIEIKAGSLYQKAIYAGAPILFGLADRALVDTVRVTWPNGLIQNELRQPVDRSLVVKEAPRLSGSCPMIFTWNGAAFQFITDVLGVAPLGASAGDGEFFPVDHDEYVSVPGEVLALTSGKYDVRVTEELREVSYLDRIQLIALDHPAEVTVLTNEKFKSPPFPEFRLFGVRRPIAPRGARDDRGVDVLDRVLALDHRYPDSYRRNVEGVAETHFIDLDFGDAAPENRALLVLSGWVDWADGSTFRGEAQKPGGGLRLPYIQVKDATGSWNTVVEDMGIPAGKPKTIVVDLAGKFLSASREVRIVTNLCVYWDRIYLSDQTAAPEVTMTTLDPEVADLRFRGFSRVVIDQARTQPEVFEYTPTSAVSMWNPTPGLYTRYGDVRPLLTAADDHLVVMGSGDEVRLLFDAAPLPSLPAGWRRDFLLLVDGWAKDADANTAYSQTVEPLPFRAMRAYPYGPNERPPADGTASTYNIRPALRLVRPLAAGVGHP